MTDDIEPIRSPFRSLEYFTRADAKVFSGREEEIEEVATRILAGDTLVVYGPSGVGKTSLLCAGVVPTLEHSRGYRTTYVRTLRSPRGDVWRAFGADPAEPLAAALARLPDSAPGEDDVAMHPSRGRGRTPHVLVIDQVEELFTRFDESERRLLWDGLVEVIEDEHASLRLVLALREEYLHFLDSAHPRLSNLLDRRFRLRGLTPFGARTAIVRPLVASKIRYEPEFVDRCVAELTEVPPGHPDDDGVVDPLLLQIVCSEAYRHAQQRDAARPWLTLADYAASGGASGVFRRHLDELFRRVHTEDHLLLLLVLQELTTAHSTKRPATVSRIAESGLLASPRDIQAVLDQLVDANLVRLYRSEKEPWYELVHDRLVKVLPEQFARDEQFLRTRFMRDIVHQLSKGFSESAAGATLLSREQLVDLVEPFRNYIRFDQRELDLLFRSAIASEHQVAAWRDAYEAVSPSGTPVVVLDLLERDSTRRSAAHAVAALRVAAPEVRTACLRVAMDDDDSDVVDAAAAALKIVAEDDEVTALNQALQDQRLRPRALRVLGAVVDHAPFRARITARERRKARRLHDREALRRARQTILFGGVRGRREGAILGGLIGVVAALFCGIVLAWLGTETSGEYLAVILAITLGAIVFGGSCGRAAGRSLARRHALQRTSSWTRILAMRSVVLICAGAPALFAAWAVVGDMFDTGLPIVELLAIAALALPVVGLAIIAIERDFTRAPRSAMRRRLWIVARASAPPWLVAIAAGWLLVHTVSTGVEEVVVLAFLGGAWFAVCSAAIGGTCAQFAHDLPAPPRRVAEAPRRFAGLAPAVVLAAVIAVVLQQNPLPFWAPVLDVGRPSAGSPDVVTAPAAVSWASGSWLRIRNRSADVRVIRVDTAPASHPYGGELLLVLPGTHIRRFYGSRNGFEATQPYRKVDLLRDAPVPGSYAVIELARAEADDGAEIWARSVPLRGATDQIAGRIVGCRVFTSGIPACSDGNIYARLKSCGTLSPGDERIVVNRVEPADPGSPTSIYVECFGARTPLGKPIKRAEAVVLFDPPPGAPRPASSADPARTEAAARSTPPRP